MIPAMTRAPTRSPAQDQGDAGAREHVQHQVQHAGHPRLPQPGDQFLGGVFQAQHEQQQDDADLAGDMAEVVDAGQIDQAAVAEGQSAQQVERNRGHSDPPGEPAQDAKAEEDDAELDERECGWVHRLPPAPFTGTAECLRPR